VSRRVGERDVFQALLDGENRPHDPLCRLLARLGILIHLEVDDATHDEVVLNCEGSQVVVAGPERAQHNRLTRLLIWHLSRVVAELNVATELTATNNVCPDAEENVLLGRHHVQDIHAR